MKRMPLSRLFITAATVGSVIIIFAVLTLLVMTALR
jgi:hypothetical protein